MPLLYCSVCGVPREGDSARAVTETLRIERTVPTTDDDSRDDDWTDADSDSDSDDGDRDPDADGADRTAYCPDCGAEVYDDADVCPKCFTWLNGETARRPPGAMRFRERARAVVVWITIAAILVGAGILWFIR